MKKFDKVHLTEAEIDALKEIIEDFEKEDQAVRERQIRDWKRYELMWCGFNNFYWDYVAHDWRIWDQDSVNADNQAAYYDKNINVFRAFMETIIAALSTTVPPIKCLPDDADNTNDVLTAKGGTKIAELVYNHIDAPLLWVKMLWIRSLQGMVCAYNYTDESLNYGYADIRSEHDELVDGQQTICPNCKSVLMENEVSAASEMQDQERDEFDPDNDDIVLHDINNSNKLFCPQCQTDIDPEIQKEKIVVTRLTGVTRQPKARQCVEIYGGLNVKVPNYARDQKDLPYLNLSFETHYTNIYEKYEDDLDEEDSLDTKITSPDGNNIYARWGRLNPQYLDDYPLNTPTERHWWLRKSTFHSLTDDKVRKSLMKKFPDGCYAIMVNDQWVKACNQNLDDHWTLLFNPMSNYVQYDPLAASVSAIQEITVNLVSLELQCIEHSIPQTFFNPKFLNAVQYSKSEVSPGQMFPTKTIGENRNISDGFHTLQTASVSPELGPFGSKINELGQFASGALPQVFGGSSPSSSRTAAQYAMQRNGAQQRLSNLTGRDINYFWKNVFSKVIPAYMKYMLDDERLVKEQGNDNFINVVIKKAQLDGKLGDIRLEAPEGLPATLEQIKETVMNLMQTNNPEILAALGSPENLPIMSKVLGLTDFNIPGESDREKQYEEILLLLGSAPIPSPDGGETSSITPELSVDNHQIEAEICRGWLVSEKGRQAKTDNPEGYKNILLHLSAHMEMLKQLSSPAPIQGSQEPSGNKMQPDNVVKMRPALSRG